MAGEVEGRFGEAPPATRAPGTIAVGQTVRVVSGRHSGSTAEVVALEIVPTPSGGSARMARIRRPRAGESWEFSSDLEALP